MFFSLLNLRELWSFTKDNFIKFQDLHLHVLIKIKMMKLKVS